MTLPTRHLASILVIACALPWAACSSKADSGTAAGDAKPPITVTVASVDHKTSVAANATYEERGLGVKAAAGKSFLCARVTVTKQDAKVALPPPVLSVGADSYDSNIQATAAFEASLDTKGDAHAPCFEIPETVKGPFEISYTKKAWGRHPGWTASAKAL